MDLSDPETWVLLFLATLGVMCNELQVIINVLATQWTPWGAKFAVGTATAASLIALGIIWIPVLKKLWELRRERADRAYGFRVGLRQLLTVAAASTAPPATLDDKKLFFLVWKLLCEKGFQHSAFTFAAELEVTFSTEKMANSSKVSMIKKGSKYAEAVFEISDQENIGLIKECLRQGAMNNAEEEDNDENSGDANRSNRHSSWSNSSILLTRALRDHQEKIALNRVQKTREQEVAEKEPSSSEPTRMHPRHVGERPFWMVNQPAKTETAAPKMVQKRIPSPNDIDISVLGNELVFPNGVRTKNRFLKAAMTERISTYVPEDHKQNGLPTPVIINMYDKWGRGGFGLLLTGNVVVDPVNLESAGNAIICREGDSAERRELFKKWATNMKQDGSLAVVQLSHAGCQTPITVCPAPFSASDVQLTAVCRFTGFGKPIPLTVEQIKTEVIDRFVFAAKFAYETGFDGIQLHAAHGYLLSQFTSSTTNKRTDQYGGSLENRLRIVLEIYDAIRAEIPASTGFLVGIKTNSVEFQSGGTTVDDAKEMCANLENKGFDFFELSGGTIEKLAFAHQRDSTRSREAFFLEFAAQVRPVFKKTVVYLTGGFRTVDDMVQAILDNATSGIGLDRPVAAEPDLPKKILNKLAASASDSELNQDDFAITNLAANSQMEQLGRQPAALVNGLLNHGVTDFSEPSVAKKYK